jgi:hypothetical protein
MFDGVKVTEEDNMWMQVKGIKLDLLEEEMAMIAYVLNLTFKWGVGKLQVKSVEREH